MLIDVAQFNNINKKMCHLWIPFALACHFILKGSVTWRRVTDGECKSSRAKATGDEALEPLME